MLDWAVLPGQAGLTQTQGGLAPLILAVGYPGPALCGLACIAAARRTATARLLTLTAALVLTVEALVFAARWTDTDFGLSLAAAAAALVAAAALPPHLARATARWLGAWMLAYTAVDIVVDTLWNPRNTETDATLLAAWTGLPAAAWGLAWSATTAACIRWAWRLAAVAEAR